MMNTLKNFACMAFSQIAAVLYPARTCGQNAMRYRKNAMVLHKATSTKIDAVIGPSQLISHRDDGEQGFALPNGDWIHLVPVDTEIEVSIHREGGKTQDIIQVFDADNLSHLASNFHGELLLNYEHHASMSDKESRAAGWIDKLQNRADGIWGHVRWTPRGRSDVTSGEYRYVSPEFSFSDGQHLGGIRYRFNTLRGAGLTNVPRLKGKLQPISHREDPNDPNQKTKNKMNEELMTRLRSYFGLPADADEAAILAAIPADSDLAETNQEVEELNHRCQALATELVEHDLERFSDVIQKDKIEVFRKQLIAHRDTTIQMLEGIQRSESQAAPARIHHRATATAPNTMDKLAAKEEAENELWKRIGARAEILHRDSKGTKSMSACFADAKAELGTK